MKLKHIMTTLGLALVLGVGVGAGLASKQQVKEAEAAQGDLLAGYQLVGAALGVGWNAAANNTYRFTEQSDGSYQWTGAISVERFRVIPGDGSWTTKLNWNNVDANNTAGGRFVKASTVTADDDNNIWCTTAGDYTITLNAAKTTLSFAVAQAVVYHSITKYAVVDGVKQGEAMGEPEHVVEGTVYAVPGAASMSGYHFEGWYTNEACTSAYVAAELNADLVLYAKFTTLVADKYIYYVTQMEDETPDYIYTFGGEQQFGSTWPGTKITEIPGVTDVHGVLDFEGKSSGRIYKIPFASAAGDDHVIINYKDELGEGQTGDMLLVAGSAYWFTLDDEFHNDEAGAALDFLCKAEAARNAVVAGEGILAYSVCGIAPAKAAELYNEYYALPEKAYVNNTTVYTYNGAYDGINVPEQTNISYENVMQQLKAIAIKGGQIVSGAKVNTTVNSNNSMIIIVLVSSMSLIAISALFIIRRRRAMR